MRVRSVQLGGSLAGKLSSELSSTLSDKSVALGISGRRLRRPLVEPRIMDRGVTERCPEAEPMNSALPMIQRLAVAAHRSPYQTRGTALVPSAFRLETDSTDRTRRDVFRSPMLPQASYFGSATSASGTKSPTHHAEKEPEPGIRVDRCGLLCMGTAQNAHRCRHFRRRRDQPDRGS